MVEQKKQANVAPDAAPKSWRAGRSRGRSAQRFLTRNLRPLSAPAKKREVRGATTAAPSRSCDEWAALLPAKNCRACALPLLVSKMRACRATSNGAVADRARRTMTGRGAKMQNASLFPRSKMLAIKLFAGNQQ
jgi:hypothetical protein